MNSEHTHEQIEAFARSAVVLAQGSGTPLWMARQIFDGAFDQAAESAGKPKHIESLGGGE